MFLSSSYFARIAEFASDDCRCLSPVVALRPHEQQVEFARGGALWNAALSTSGIGFALAEFGIFRWAQNFRDGWNFSFFADLERAGGGFDDAVPRPASGISRRNDSLAHVCQNIAQLSGIGGQSRRT